MALAVDHKFEIVGGDNLRNVLRKNLSGEGESRERYGDEKKK